jgi:putative transposase
VIVTFVRLLRPGGLRSVLAESALVRHQLLILNRGRKRAPNLRVSDRIIAGLFTLLMRPARVLRNAIVLRPSTLLHFHQMLTKRKYRMLFSPECRGRPGPKGPAKELIDAVVEMKRRNTRWGCRRIAQQIALAFGVDIDKDVVRRILGLHFARNRGRRVRLGLHSLAIRRTVCGAPISFAVNRSHYEHIGFSWSWTNSHVGSSGLVFTEGLSTD